METVHFQGTPFKTTGNMPKVGEAAPAFTLVTPQLQEVTPADYKGKRVVLNVFPSLDTPVCASSVRRFNKEASSLDNTVVLCVSMDLPFAAGRFCEVEGLKDVIPASAFRAPALMDNYGVRLADGPLAGLLTRAVIILDEEGKVAYTDLVNEITEEPCYDKALAVLK